MSMEEKRNQQTLRYMKTGWGPQDNFLSYPHHSGEWPGPWLPGKLYQTAQAIWPGARTGFKSLWQWMGSFCLIMGKIYQVLHKTHLIKWFNNVFHRTILKSEYEKHSIHHHHNDQSCHDKMINHNFRLPFLSTIHTNHEYHSSMEKDTMEKAKACQVLIRSGREIAKLHCNVKLREGFGNIIILICLPHLKAAL